LPNQLSSKQNSYINPASTEQNIFSSIQLPLRVQSAWLCLR